MKIERINGVDIIELDPPLHERDDIEIPGAPGLTITLTPPGSGKSKRAWEDALAAGSALYIAPWTELVRRQASSYGVASLGLAKVRPTKTATHTASTFASLPKVQRRGHEVLIVDEYSQVLDFAVSECSDDGSAVLGDLFRRAAAAEKAHFLDADGEHHVGFVVEMYRRYAPDKPVRVIHRDPYPSGRLVEVVALGLELEAFWEAVGRREFPIAFMILSPNRARSVFEILRKEGVKAMIFTGPEKSKGDVRDAEVIIFNTAFCSGVSLEFPIRHMFVRQDCLDISTEKIVQGIWRPRILENKRVICGQKRSSPVRIINPDERLHLVRATTDRIIEVVAGVQPERRSDDVYRQLVSLHDERLDRHRVDPRAYLGERLKRVGVSCEFRDAAKPKRRSVASEKSKAGKQLQHEHWCRRMKRASRNDAPEQDQTEREHLLRAYEQEQLTQKLLDFDRQGEGRKKCERYARLVDCVDGDGSHSMAIEHHRMRRWSAEQVGHQGVRPTKDVFAAAIVQEVFGGWDGCFNQSTAEQLFATELAKAAGVHPGGDLRKKVSSCLQKYGVTIRGDQLHRDDVQRWAGPFVKRHNEMGKIAQMKLGRTGS